MLTMSRPMRGTLKHSPENRCSALSVASRRELLRRLSLVLPILLSCILLGSISSVVGVSPVYVEGTERHILQGDTFVTYISPVVERLSVDTFSFTPDLDFRVSFFLNDSESQTSVVEMQPRSEGAYNLTVMFQTENAWNYTVGVFTNTPGFYSEYADILDTRRGSFVTLYTRTVKGFSGNSTLIFTLNSHNSDPSAAMDPPISLFTLPASAGVVVFVAVTAILAYANAFFMADSYFSTQEEGLSWKRWALILVVFCASLWVIYQVYLFAMA